jgi:hypothetical protein
MKIFPSSGYLVIVVLIAGKTHDSTGSGTRLEVDKVDIAISIRIKLANCSGRELACPFENTVLLNDTIRAKLFGGKMSVSRTLSDKAIAKVDFNNRHISDSVGCSTRGHKYALQSNLRCRLEYRIESLLIKANYIQIN